MPNLLIKDVPQETIDLFNQIKKVTKLKALPALELLISHYNNPGTSNPQPPVIDNSEEVTELQNKLIELKEQLQEAQSKPVGITLEGKQFIYSPTPEMAGKMQRVISYLIHEKTFSRDAKDLPAQLVTKSLNYTIKNEYQHILK